MNKFYVMVAPGPVVVVANSSPILTGYPIGYRLYEIEAATKSDAKDVARRMFAAE